MEKIKSNIRFAANAFADAPVAMNLAIEGLREYNVGVSKLVKEAIEAMSKYREWEAENKELFEKLYKIAEG